MPHTPFCTLFARAPPSFSLSRTTGADHTPTHIVRAHAFSRLLTTPHGVSGLFPLRASNEGHSSHPPTPRIPETPLSRWPRVGRAPKPPQRPDHLLTQRFHTLPSSSYPQGTRMDAPLRALTDHGPPSNVLWNPRGRAASKEHPSAHPALPPHCHPVTSYPFSCRHRLTKFV